MSPVPALQSNPHRSRQFLPKFLAELWLERCPMERYECRVCGKQVLTPGNMSGILSHSLDCSREQHKIGV